MKSYIFIFVLLVTNLAFGSDLIKEFGGFTREEVGAVQEFLKEKQDQVIGGDDDGPFDPAPKTPPKNKDICDVYPKACLDSKES